MIMSNNILNKHVGPETKTQLQHIIAINKNISELHTIYEVKDKINRFIVRLRHITYRLLVWSDFI